VLLRRATDTETSITLDSLVSSTNDRKSQSGSYNTERSSTNCNDDDTALSNASASFKPISGPAVDERDMPTKAPFKRKPLGDNESHNDAENCSDSKKLCGHQNAQRHNQFSSVSSEDFSDITVNRSLKDTRVHASNEQTRHELKKYGLRKRKNCRVDNGLETEVSQSTGEEMSGNKMDADDGTMGDQNQTVYRKPKRTSTLTPAHCLVLKRPICCICSLAFSSLADCIIHWRRDHIVTDPSGNTKPHLTCRQCPMRFAVPASRLNCDLHVGIQVARWLNHAVRVHNLEIPSDVEKFVCGEPECSFIALTPASYQNHQQKNRHDGIPGRGTSALVYFELCCFLCTATDGCREVFSSKPALQEHIVEKHVRRDDVRQVLLCPVCNVERPLTRPGPDDVDQSRQTPSRRFFYVIYRLLHHLVSKHGWSVPEYIRSYLCKFPDCRYVAVAQSDLDSHSISHDGTDGSGASRNPSLPCEKCGKLVKFRAMQSHIRLCQVSVEDRQTQKCPYCSTRLSSRYNLRYHIKAMHSGASTSKEFLCSDCTYSCHHKSNLEEHIFHRHGSNVSRRSVVCCTLCQFATIKQGALRRHTSLVHSDAKTFRCPVCDKMFKCQCKKLPVDSIMSYYFCFSTTREVT